MSRAARPTIEQTRAIFRLLGDMRDLSADPRASRGHAVKELCTLLGARQGTMLRLEGFQLGQQMKLLSAVHDGWANPAAVALWETALRSQQFDQDVLLSRSREIDTLKPAKGRAVTMLREEIVPDRVFYGAPLIREIIPLIEIDSHVCGWQTPVKGGPTIGMTFHRILGSKPFAPREREILRLFMEEMTRLEKEGKLPGDKSPASPRPQPALSPREKDVLKQLIAGHSVKQAAVVLNLSRRTVEDYVKAIYRKYEVHSRGELLGRVLGNGESQA